LTILAIGILFSNPDVAPVLGPDGDLVNPGFSFSLIIKYVGYVLLTSLIIGVLVSYLKRFYPDQFKSVKGIGFVLFWPLLFSFLVFIVERSSVLSVYLIPFCIVPIVVKNFFKEQLALFLHITVVLIASYISDASYEFTFIQILAGSVVVLWDSETRKWDKFFVTVAVVLVIYALGFLGINMIQGQSEVVSDIRVFGWLTVNGLLLLLAYPFIPIIEKIFGFTSSISLAELSDMNSPLIKKLSTKAPGTLQHSLQVGNLCQAAANAIGLDSLLLKTAALYHDIGKTENPHYFIENNPSTNLHAELDNNFESARIIIGHVTKGIEIAEKAKLPKEIIDFIRTHHGTTRVEYFYRNQMKDFPDQEFDESIFVYPGPKPQTKEQAIMMLADSIEAACKSLNNPTGDELDAFVDKIANAKVASEQLSDSDLSFKEFEICIETFKKMLHSVYHVRVAYPEVQKNRLKL